MIFKITEVFELAASAGFEYARGSFQAGVGRVAAAGRRRRAALRAPDGRAVRVRGPRGAGRGARAAGGALQGRTSASRAQRRQRGLRLLQADAARGACSRSRARCRTRTSAIASQSTVLRRARRRRAAAKSARGRRRRACWTSRS